MLTNTPWYVSNKVLPLRAFRGNSKGISVLSAGIFPGGAISMLNDTKGIGCAEMINYSSPDHQDTVYNSLAPLKLKKLTLTEL